ncbi:MAG TPA: molybdopterin-dependent oxidoreductase [Capsulimonadaceae bacterium]|jgi:DMSO/TMAO reductase YedYZ molybdopterin-dependent catalytic subunit
MSSENKTPRSAVAPVETDADAAIRRLSRRSFILGGIATAATVGGFTWLMNAPPSDGIPGPLRRMLRFNETLAETFFQPSRLIPTLSLDRVTKPARVNGDIGLSEEVNLDDWTVQVQPAKAITATDDDFDEFTLADIKKLPRHEMVTELHCIEGWTMVQHWAGARFCDFVEQMTRFHDLKSVPKYVGIETPDGAYYVGLDRASALHPQTLLCYEMNGEPLTQDHGAPLRLVIPVKYGVKNLKRIGVIKFTNARPGDYWAEQGYDWYAGF